LKALQFAFGVFDADDYIINRIGGSFPVSVQFLGCPQVVSTRALWPASEKRQGTKSREWSQVVPRALWGLEPSAAVEAR